MAVSKYIREIEASKACGKFAKSENYFLKVILKTKNVEVVKIAKKKMLNFCNKITPVIEQTNYLRVRFEPLKFHSDLCFIFCFLV